MSYIIKAFAVIILLLTGAIDVSAASWRSITVKVGETSDIQASDDETVDVIFSDGTSAVLSPGSTLSVLGYSFEAGSLENRLAIRVSSGKVRVSGGRLNETAPITIETPMLFLTIYAGSAMISASGSETTAYLLNGESLTVAAMGQETRIFRPEFGVTASAVELEGPRRIDAAIIASDLSAFEQAIVVAGLSDLSLRPREQLESSNTETQSTEPVAQTPDRRPDIGDLTENRTPQMGPLLEVDFTEGFGTISDGRDYQPAIGGAPLNVVESNSTISDGTIADVAQDFVIIPDVDLVIDGFQGQPRKFGPTTSKIFTSANLTMPLNDGQPLSVSPDEGGLSFFASTRGVFSVLGVKSAQTPLSRSNDALFFIELPTTGRFESTTKIDSVEAFSDSGGFSGSFGHFSLVDEGENEIGLIADGLNYGLELAQQDIREPFDFGFLYVEFQIADSNIFDLGNDDERMAADLAEEEALARGLRVFREEGDFSFNGVALIEREDDPNRIVFATGNVDAAADRAISSDVVVDRFFVSPGLTEALTFSDLNPTTPPGSDLMSGERAFVGGETWPNFETSSLTDNGLYVANPVGNHLLVSAPFLHADFGLSNDEDGQSSTISATIGNITYRPSEALSISGLADNPDTPIDESLLDLPAVAEVDAIADGRTVGTTRAGTSSTLFGGPVKSTASGGGNPILDPGYAGFFVFENAGLVFDDVVSPNPTTLPGGVERPLGSDAPDVGYAIGRLAVATETGTPDRSFDGETSLFGYAAGLTELETDGEITLQPFADPARGPNFRLSDFDLDANTFSASAEGESVTINFGGSGASAWIDDRVFGARAFMEASTQAAETVPQEVGLVSGDLVATGLAEQFESAEGDTLTFTGADGAITAIPGGYKYVKWGYFFGDLLPATEGQRMHQHLGTFAAGALPDVNELMNTTGEVTFVGHAVGDVFDRGALRSVVGTYRETFDFGSRTGSTTLDFDERLFTNPVETPSRLLDSRYTATVQSGDIRGQLDGRFVSPVTSDTPAGVLGSFRLQNQGATTDTAYRATGTFAGEKR